MLAQYYTGYLTLHAVVSDYIWLLCVHFYGVFYVENGENVFINLSSLYIHLNRCQTWFYIDRLLY